MAVHRASNRPPVPQAYQECKITQSTGMATQRQLKVFKYLEGNHMAPGRLERKKQQQSRVFFGFIFYVYTDNRERARASY